MGGWCRGRWYRPPVNDGPRYATLADYLQVVRERRLLVALITLLFAGAAVVWSVRQDPVYESEASLEFKSVNAETSIVGTVTFDAQTAEQRAAIAAEGVARPEVVERARELLGRGEADLASAVSARAESRTNLVVITARSGEPEQAAAIANAFARAHRDVTTEETRELYLQAADVQRRALRRLPRSKRFDVTRTVTQTQVNQLEQVARLVTPVEIRRAAAAPRDPVSPRPIRNTVLGLVLGLTLGLVAAFVRDALDRRFKSFREIAAELHLPLVGAIGEDVLGRTVVANGREPLSAEDLEGFRILRTNVEFLDVDRPPKVVLVTSALPEEGKSTVATALAYACASAGKRTLLLECDLRRPTQAARLGIAPRPGLTDYLAGDAAPPDILQTVSLAAPGGNGAAPAGPVLVCITAGTMTPQPAELLRSERFVAFLEQVSAVYDHVVVDTSPLLPVVDTLELLPRADAVVLCVRASVTTRDQVRAAKTAVDHFPQRPMGVVVTGLRAGDRHPEYSYYSYSYGPS